MPDQPNPSVDHSPSDKFVDMVSARASVDLPLSDFQPRSSLTTPVHPIEQPRFPVIDFHNHVDSVEATALLETMDRSGVEFLVNITMQTGQAGLAQMDRLRRAAPDRFASIGWMDWTDVLDPHFASRTCDRLEQMRDHGAIGIKFWKDLGLSVRDEQGALLHIDDDRLAPIFAKAGDLGLAVMFHTSDPTAFFDPITPENERFEELAAHPDWGFSDSPVSKRELLEQRNRVIARHPTATFVGAHLAESGEDLAFLAHTLDTHPNLLIDISARTPELGRQPYRARELFLRYPDRILFGTDLLPEVDMYRLYFRFLETADEYFEYPSHASRQGRWNIYGIFLPDDVLQKIYRDNARKLLPSLR